jgi:translation initiation factor 1 (eIF-1/SUI1)
MQLNSDDLKKHKALKMIINKSKIELQGDAVNAVSSLFLWFDDLGNRIDEALKPKPSGEIKPIEKKKGKK